MTSPKPIYMTHRGEMYHGSAASLLKEPPLLQERGSVQLVFSSPPFPLNKKKAYGNLEGEEYLEWLRSFAPILRDYLTDDGSIVIELGNAWVSGSPTMSTLPIEALLAFREAADLHLCQEFIWFNPARLPSPIQWVNVDRIRVKDAFTRVWWMSPTDRPKADNRRVLTAYSDSMKRLLKKGTYNPGHRPSEYVIGDDSFLTDHGGAIPPNVVVPPAEEILPQLLEVIPLANTRSRDSYLDHCRHAGITPHPARMPPRLAEFFIRFLTDQDDLVLDPFAGSNTTGAVAESLARTWVSIEADLDYAIASQARFEHVIQATTTTAPSDE